MKKKIILLTSILSILILTSVFAYQKISSDINKEYKNETAPRPMYRGNLQRTGYYPSSLDIKKPKLLWKRDINDKQYNGISVENNFIVGNDSIYLTGANLFSINSKNGKLKWKSSLKDDYSYTPPIKEKNIIYTGIDYKYSAAINSLNGKLLWSKKFNIEDSLIYKNIAYVTSNQESLCALDLSNKNVLWTFNAEDSGYPSTYPSYQHGKLFFGIGDYYYAINAVSGKQIWKFNYFHDKKFEPMEDMQSRAYLPPVLANGKVYIGVDYTIGCLSADSGKLIWKLKPEIYPVKDLSIYRNILIIKTLDRKLIALNNKNGKIIWIQEFDKCTSPIISNKTIYLGVKYKNIFYLYALDLKTGKKKWSFRSKGNINTNPVIYKNTIYFIDDFYLYALK